jgi:hypothetical protein
LLEVLEDRTLPSFLTPVNYAVGTAPVPVVTADLANSDKLDLITANASDNTVSVRMGNGDGQLHIVTANEGNNTVSVLLGNGDGTRRRSVKGTQLRAAHPGRNRCRLPRWPNDRVSGTASLTCFGALDLRAQAVVPRAFKSDTPT